MIRSFGFLGVTAAFAERATLSIDRLRLDRSAA